MESVAFIRNRVLQLHEELERAVEDISSEALHWKPSENAWSVAQVLAHVSEFEHFFSSDVLNLKANPGARFGRTVDHPERLRAVALSRDEALEDLLEGVRRGKQEVLSMLGALRDDDLEIEGDNPKFGRRTIAWVIDHFIIEHLEKHIGQIRRTYAAFCNNN
ncbi:DinB family protein [Alicyclobacillus acidocaldarius]|uniref:DinB-like domain-containing protein n=1 Tax=Alicyclobacillus acidocaldarius (strain Tc-4-1) TaxID=1048834 RepID=F8ICS9_ALIAT|nr:DinB family protein [Alicyclobacillus acidocaldarius]AEJ43744.1 conserved hypothetical protein [Alicyclobacillus acidocaldarius subsp. acidocaldarius Tc-4-1]